MSSLTLVLVFDNKDVKSDRIADLPKVIQDLLFRIQKTPILTSSVLRLIPIIPSCACVLMCLELNMSRKDIIGGTLVAGWVRPVILGIAGSHIATLADLWIRLT